MSQLQFYQSDRGSAAMLISLALAEDLREIGDLTSGNLIDSELQATIKVVSRQRGIVAGQPVAEMLFQQLDHSVVWTTQLPDGSDVEPGSLIATVEGSVVSLLKGERTALNFLTQLSGVATLTQQYVDLVADTKAVILDTRKTWPGFRNLEKYAVRAGGGTNHRMGLYDGVMIKDNHLAAWNTSGAGTIADAIQEVRNKVDQGIPIEVEVDTLDQLKAALPAKPDYILLDNMPPNLLREAVSIRDAVSPQILLEASGGINLETVRAVAESGVDRISIGALTHSVIGLDIGFDWK
ncbi:MAG: carboxylating nicotinate-nucleotide diphosphorylase [Planctomycetaceae bacterium]|jgi:nicotinate-nucleotide pyrophosphorylase (carboxylating)|nr:carboxylating nicotinate-nucleotide diphosphorylase [Planctomycetaceae bacterium]MDC0273985.1 carboxylating nicotinate-nucleotide diphosphorylase [Planctomycetaceae bacterium]MDG2391265.1 carboxylating nicotinate-nucleotide diphosphorylase [Planctomycetaceae bacterium]